MILSATQRCNDMYVVDGAVHHCTLKPHVGTDHAQGPVTWTQHPTTSARWTTLHAGGFVFHAIANSKVTQCGLGINNLTPRTIKGRTVAHCPAGNACPSCIAITCL